MNSTHRQPQLSALALIDAHRVGDFQAVSSVLMHTPPLELHEGLVLLASGFATQIAADNGTSISDVLDIYRQGILNTPSEATE